MISYLSEFLIAIPAVALLALGAFCTIADRREGLGTFIEHSLVVSIAVVVASVFSILPGAMGFGLMMPNSPDDTECRIVCENTEDLEFITQGNYVTVFEGGEVLYPTAIRRETLTYVNGTEKSEKETKEDVEESKRRDRVREILKKILE